MAENIGNESTMSDNWLADVLGEGAAFQTDANPNRYKNMAASIYNNAIQNKRAEMGNVENDNLSKASQTAAQYGITGPAAAALQHNAVQGSEYQTNVATNDLEAQSRQAAYNAALKDEETKQQREVAKQQAYANMGKKGMSLLAGALSLGTGTGVITSGTTFLGGLSKLMGMNPLSGAAEAAKIAANPGPLTGKAQAAEELGNLKYQPEIQDQSIPPEDTTKDTTGNMEDTTTPSDWLDFGKVEKVEKVKKLKKR